MLPLGLGLVLGLGLGLVLGLGLGLLLALGLLLVCGLAMGLRRGLGLGAGTNSYRRLGSLVMVLDPMLRCGLNVKNGGFRPPHLPLVLGNPCPCPPEVTSTR